MVQFQHHGFAFPPVGLIEIISRSSIPDGSSVYIIDPIGNGLPPYDEIISLNRENSWIIINTHEPASHHWFDQLIDYLTDQCGIEHDKIILHSACLYDPDSTIHTVGSIVDYASDIVSQLGDQLIIGEINHHYVCLNRLHRWQRWRLIKILKERGIDRYGKISYLESQPPMILDSAEIAWSDQRDISHPGIKNAIINLITESGYEPDPDNPVLQTHHRPGFTEKTFKSIYLAQFPIWVSSYKTVECYRTLGFDAFDDVIDHGYDLEPDPEIRLRMIADEIGRLVQIPLTDWQNLRDQNIQRFQNNLDKLIWYHCNHEYELPKWNQIFEQLT